MRICLILALAFSTQIQAQELPPAETDAPPAPAPQYCQSGEHRQFDFWLGDWQVTANGQPAGTNRVESVLNGCAIQENWEGTGGISGSSFNIYDRATGMWHQTWVDSSGTLLQLDGRLDGDSMVLQGSRPVAESGGTAQHRIRWTPNEDGTLRQLWEASQDSGASWTVLFDGLYSPRTDDSASCVLDPPSRAMACTMQYDPVCGCDGKTYGNACSAKGAGVPHWTPGECGQVLEAR